MADEKPAPKPPPKQAAPQAAGAKPPPKQVAVQQKPAVQQAAAQTRVTLSKPKVKIGGGILAQMKAGKESSLENIEERVAGIEGFDEVKMPELFKTFYSTLAPKMTLPRTSYTILKAFANIDVTTEKVAGCLKLNQYYGSQFFKNIASVQKREELPTAEGAVLLLGMQNSRNFIIGMQMLRTVTGAHPEWTKEGKLKTAPNELIKCALKVEEVLAGDKSSYSDTAYAAGVMFDILTLIAMNTVEDKKKISAYIDTVFTHSLLAAKIGKELARNMPDFSFTKYIFAACLIHDIGKVMLAIMNPQYYQYVEEVGKKGLPRIIRHYAEGKQYGVNHALLGGLACNFYKIFKPIDKAILYHHEPYLLRTANKGMFQLASMVCLATNMATSFKKVDRGDDPVLLQWKGPEIRDFRIDNRAIISATQKAV